MAGCRPLTKEEYERLMLSLDPATLSGARMRALVAFMCHTGYRISEALSLSIGDVLGEDGALLLFVTVSRRHMKGGRKAARSAESRLLERLAKASGVKIRDQRTKKVNVSSRTMVLNDAVRAELAQWLLLLRTHDALYRETPLFCSLNLRRWTRHNALRAVQVAFRRCGLSGKLGTHTLRKTFAKWIYDDSLEQVAYGQRLDPIRIARQALGHANISNTEKYLESIGETVFDIVRRMGGGRGF